MDVSVTEFRARLKDYLDLVEKGEEIVIIRNSTIVGRLMPTEASLKAAEQRGDMSALIYKLDDDREIRFRRPGLHEDSSKIIQLHLDALRAAGALVGNRAELDLDLDGPSSYYEQSGGEFWVGELDGEVMAMGAFRLAIESPAGTAELKRMRVKPELQGKGIGGTLLRFLEARAKKAGYKSVVLDVTDMEGQAAARHFYKSHDYKEFDRRLFEDFENIYYRKEL